MILGDPAVADFSGEPTPPPQEYAHLFAVSARDDEERLHYLFPGTQSWHVAVRYAIAFGAVGAAIAARWLLNPILGDQLIFAPLLIVLLPLLLIVRPATFLVAAFAGLMVSWYLFVPPQSPTFGGEEFAAVQLILCAAAVLAACVAAWLMQRVRQRLSMVERRVSVAQDLASGAFFDTGWTTGDVVGRLFGLPAGAALPADQKSENGVVVDGLADVKRVLDAAVECRLTYVAFEYGAVSPDGSRRWLAASGQLSYREHDRSVRLIGVTVDVSERKRAEEALRLVNQRKDDFLAALAHELRNPLSPIRTVGQIMRRGMSNECIEWCHDVIERQTAHLARLVDDLLDITRIARGKIAIRKAEVDLRQILENAIEIVRPALDRRSLRTAVDLPAEPVTFQADSVRLAQVFANLLTNAAKFSPDGALITVRGERRGSEIIVSVIDQGIGIEPEALPAVFDIFSQPQRPVDGAADGLGLGLAIVRNLVELHGGTVAAHSDGRGRGSKFVVRLRARNLMAAS